MRKCGRPNLGRYATYLVLMTCYQLFLPFGFCGKPVGPPDPLPIATGINQITEAIFDPANNVIRVEASPGPAGTHTPSNADQVFMSVFDATNNAIHIECLSGCAGSSLTAETNGTVNASQATLNLMNGTDIALTNASGTGNVTFNFTGMLPATQAQQSNEFLTGYNAGTGTFILAQPTFGNISGTASASQMPNPAGDISGTYAAMAVTGLHFGPAAYPLAATALSSGQCLEYNGTSIIGASCGSGGSSLPSTWSVNGAANTVLGQPASGQDAVTLQLAPSVSSPTADIFQVYLPGATPSAACATNTKCAFGIQANGNLYMLGNSLTLGGANQPTASNALLYGGTPGQAYLELSSAALSPPATPTAAPAIGGSLPALTSYDVEITYCNGTSCSGETTPSSVAVTTATSSTCATSGNCSIQVTSPAPETNATAYKVYLKTAGGSNYFLQNGAGGTAIGTNFTMMTENTSSPNPPGANTTGSVYNTFLSMSAEGSGILCASSSVPGQDCANGTTLVEQAAGAPTTGDCVKWTGANQIGDAGAVCGSGSASSPWSSLTAPTANLSLSMGGYSSTLAWATGNEINWGTAGNVLYQNINPASSGSNQNSPSLTIGGTIWNGSTSVNDQWSIQDVPASGPNPTSTLKFAQTGSTGNPYLEVADGGFLSVTPSSFTGVNYYVQRPAGASNDYVEMWQNGTDYFRVNSLGYLTDYAQEFNETVAPGGAGTVDVVWGDSGGHVLRTKLNNGPALDIATQGVNNIPYSTTPTLDMSKGNVQQFSCSSAGAAISPGTVNLRAGQMMTFVFIQNGTTACTVAFPSNMHGATAVGTTLSGINTQQFVVTNNGTDLYAVSSGVQNMSGGTP